jgi:hypothetical protein
MWTELDCRLSDSEVRMTVRLMAGSAALYRQHSDFGGIKDP